MSWERIPKSGFLCLRNRVGEFWNIGQEAQQLMSIVHPMDQT